MKRKKISKLINQLEILGILTTIVMMVLIVSSFYIGYHNIDLAYNFQGVTNEINSYGLYNSNGTLIYINSDKLFDTGSDFISRPLKIYYINSMNKISNYFLIAILDSIVLGILLARRLK